MILLLFLLVVIFVFYKTRIRRKSYVNQNCYIYYDKRFGSDAYILTGTLIDTNKQNDNKIDGYYIDGNKLYYIQGSDPLGYNYYIADMDSLGVRELKYTDTIVINDRKIEVGEIDYKSPFWFLVFN